MTETSTLIKKKNKNKYKEPQRYKVIMLNDDFTTMDFVIFILKKIFHKDNVKAFELMMQIHTKGKAVVGIYNYDIATTKINHTHSFARENNFPLKCIMEKE